MPSISIDVSMAKSDPRFAKLVSLLTNEETEKKGLVEHLALGVLVEAIREAYPYWKCYNPIPSWDWTFRFPNGKHLIEAGYAQVLPCGGVILRNIRDAYAYESDEERERNNYI